ncbi:DoxX family protein [Micromonospora echinospora]|uniref:DoxX family protein n=1 Tax=Micromonospora echinospora TaxID=1877 RepID=UPI00119FEE76
MNVALWAIAGLLAAVFLVIGGIKLARPKEQLLANGMEALAPLPPGLIKFIGAAEVLAAFGLILPGLLDIAPVLVPLAAVGLLVIMVGAVVTHALRREVGPVLRNVVLVALLVLVVWGRFGPYAF